MGAVAKRMKPWAEKIVPGKQFPIDEALALVKQFATAKFDEAIDVAVNLGIDASKSDQQVRGSTVLPNGTGKTVRVLVFAQGDGAAAAREAGADVVADDDETIARIQGGWTDFDVAIATPDMMGKVGRLGRILGPRGLMPNPKAGTVVPAEDIARVINESKAGRVEFRIDKTSNLHIPIGKVSFDEKALYENLAALMEAIKKAKPSAAKGTYIRRITLTTTMGPGIKMDPAQSQAMQVQE